MKNKFKNSALMIILILIIKISIMEAFPSNSFQTLSTRSLFQSNELEDLYKSIDKKMLTEDILFDPRHIEIENKKSREQFTIVFDFDQTIGEHQSIINPVIEGYIESLYAEGFRLIIWSHAADENILKKFFTLHPQLEKYFDNFISTNFDVQMGANFDETKEILNKAYNYNDELPSIPIDQITAYYNEDSFIKNIGLYGYHVIIDDNLKLIENRDKNLTPNETHAIQVPRFTINTRKNLKMEHAAYAKYLIGQISTYQKKNLSFFFKSYAEIMDIFHYTFTTHHNEDQIIFNDLKPQKGKKQQSFNLQLNEIPNTFLSFVEEAINPNSWSSRYFNHFILNKYFPFFDEAKFITIYSKRSTYELEMSHKDYLSNQIILHLNKLSITDFEYIEFENLYIELITGINSFIMITNEDQRLERLTLTKQRMKHLLLLREYIYRHHSDKIKKRSFLKSPLVKLLKPIKSLIPRKGLLQQKSA